MSMTSDQLQSVVRRLIFEGKVKSQAALAAELDYSRGYFNQLVKGAKPIPKEVEDKVIRLFGEEYLTLANAQNDGVEEAVAAYSKPHQNAREIGAPGDEFTSNKNNHFQKLGDDKYLMFTRLVNKRAGAAYLAGWGDDEYIETLPVHAIIVDEPHKGVYRSFEISGDSADDDSKRSICDGDIVTGRQLSRSHWKNKLHNHRFPYWVIVHRTEGILCKMIAEQDTKNGTILCTSRNPDKKKYPDLLLHLNDISEIYNVVQITKSGKDL